MTADHEAAVRKSWTLIEPHFGAISTRFFERLFEADPAIEPLFRHTNLAGLRHKLLLTLGEMVRLLDEPERLVAVIAPLGRRHAGYGVREPDYATATAALIGAMRDVMADAFTEEMAEGWRELHGLVSAVMVRAG